MSHCGDIVKTKVTLNVPLFEGYQMLPNVAKCYRMLVQYPLTKRDYWALRRASKIIERCGASEIIERCGEQVRLLDVAEQARLLSVAESKWNYWTLRRASKIIERCGEQVRLLNVAESKLGYWTLRRASEIIKRCGASIVSSGGHESALCRATKVWLAMPFSIFGGTLVPCWSTLCFEGFC